jgi:hypothetical protein
MIDKDLDDVLVDRAINGLRIDRLLKVRKTVQVPDGNKAMHLIDVPKVVAAMQGSVEDYNNSMMKSIGSSFGVSSEGVGRDPYLGQVRMMRGLPELNTFDGVRFVVDDKICLFNVPVREHRRRRWMSDQYHRRIQKKWTKRFGVTIQDHSYYVNGVMHVSSRVMQQMKQMKQGI